MSEPPFYCISEEFIRNGHRWWLGVSPGPGREASMAVMTTLLTWAGGVAGARVWGTITVLAQGGWQRPPLGIGTPHCPLLAAQAAPSLRPAHAPLPCGRRAKGGGERVYTHILTPRHPLTHTHTQTQFAVISILCN